MSTAREQSPYQRQEYDDLVWEKSEEEWEDAMEPFRRSETHAKFESLIKTILGRPGKLHRGRAVGAFNVTYRMSFDDERGEVVLRLPWPVVNKFPTEKLIAEAAAMRCISQNTSIPIPEVYYLGPAEENPCGLGPFIIISYIRNAGNIARTLTTEESFRAGEYYRLDPSVPEEELEHVYKQMAGYILQLYKLEFSCIGSLMPAGAANDRRDASWSVTGRPITLNMNNLVQLAKVPPGVLPPQGTTYKSSDGWYAALADMHMMHLVFQRNDLVESPDDCRNKYVARVLFRRLAKAGKLSRFGFADDDWSAQASKISSSMWSSRRDLPRSPDNHGPFRLWCDDLRPGNVLTNRGRHIQGVIDWEFTYAAPPQFSLDPPWWLILQDPERCPDGLDGWTQAYEPCMQTWLRCLEAVEREDGAAEITEALHGISLKSINTRHPTQGDTISLSKHMRYSWDSGRFWLNQAARKSWLFDAIYWWDLDARFFGNRDTTAGAQKEDLWKARVDLLTKEEKEAMEFLVQTKMEEKLLRNTVDWELAQAQEHLAQFLF